MTTDNKIRILLEANLFNERLLKLNIGEKLASKLEFDIAINEVKIDDLKSKWDVSGRNFK